jgi:conflict system STAND superfamily ATPase
MKVQAGALPFLEHTLFKLWEMRHGRRLRAKAYTEMGRLGAALDAHADPQAKVQRIPRNAYQWTTWPRRMRC